MSPFAPSDKEDEYFLTIDQDKIIQMRSELDKKRSEAAKQQRKETHWMKCPKCGTNLAEINYQNVMIDTCSECKGIWLDQGELELLVKGQAKVTKSFFQKLFD
jgi:acetyl-CoA carboxylase beta subunit